MPGCVLLQQRWCAVCVWGSRAGRAQLHGTRCLLVEHTLHCNVYMHTYCMCVTCVFDFELYHLHAELPPPSHTQTNIDLTAHPAHRATHMCANSHLQFWKRYTRPGLVGSSRFTFSLPGDTLLQLVAARDVGLAAAAAMTDPNPGRWAGVTLPLAGDELTPTQMCEAFGEAQGLGAPVTHVCPPAWIFWVLSR
jgi:NmrA-like family